MTPVDSSAPERLALGQAFALGALAFALLFTYGLTRPPIESLFLGHHGSRALPWVWLSVVVGSAVATGLYVRTTARRDLLSVLVLSCGVSAGALAALLSLAHAGAPGVYFALYVWKDVYIVVLVEAFWCLSNVLLPTAVARRWYGTFLLFGSLGGLAANLVVRLGASRIPTLWIPWACVGVLIAIALAVQAAGRAHRLHAPRPPVAPPVPYLAAVGTVRRSPYLAALFAVIVCSQVAATLIDFRFNTWAEQTYPVLEERTAAISQVYASIDLLAFGLQLSAGAVLWLLGAVGAFVGVPAVVAAVTLTSHLAPGVATAGGLKVISKGLDYSLFRAAKELLYIPLTYQEKVNGKAVIDVFGYRMAKALGSALILAISAAAAGPLTVAAVVGWLALSGLATFHHRRRARATLATATAVPGGQ